MSLNKIRLHPVAQCIKALRDCIHQRFVTDLGYVSDVRLLNGRLTHRRTALRNVPEVVMYVGVQRFDDNDQRIIGNTWYQEITPNVMIVMSHAENNELELQTLAYELTALAANNKFGGFTSIPRKIQANDVTSIFYDQQQLGVWSVIWDATVEVKMTPTGPELTPFRGVDVSVQLDDDDEIEKQFRVQIPRTDG